MAQKYGTIAMIILIFIIFSFLSPTFTSSSNILLLLRQIAILSLVGCGMTIVIVGGAFDLSIGGITILSSALVAALQAKGYGVAPAVIVTMAAGFILGGFNGLVVAKIKIPFNHRNFGHPLLIHWFYAPC